MEEEEEEEEEPSEDPSSNPGPESDAESSGGAERVEFMDKILGNAQEPATSLSIEMLPEYKDLPLFLPTRNSLEDLRIVGPLEMVDDLAPWLESARDDLWLPNLKTIAFQLTIQRRNAPPIAGGSSSQAQEFLDLLAANCSEPSITSNR
jgi:hypothetical protein